MEFLVATGGCQRPTAYLRVINARMLISVGTVGMITTSHGLRQAYSLYAWFPNAVMTRGMNDGVYDHGVTYYAEDDAVGKPVR
jgi:hypothetical protein